MTTTEKPLIRIIHHMARSGGTLISKCLGCMDGITLLSEVHPVAYSLYAPEDKGTQFHPIIQAYRWFDLFTTTEAEQIVTRRSIDFATLIELIFHRCAARGQTLVLRDWSHVDFTSHPPFPPPTYRFSLLDALQEHFRFRRIATVRHPIDQWLSLRRLTVIQGQITVDDYLRGYRHFAEKAVEIGFLRYDDIVCTPEAQIRRLCMRLDLPFDADFITKWADYRKVTGDLDQTRSHTQIRSLPRRQHEPELIGLFERNSDYWKSLELLGYSHPQGVVGPSSNVQTPVPAPKFFSINTDQLRSDVRS